MTPFSRDKWTGFKSGYLTSKILFFSKFIWQFHLVYNLLTLAWTEKDSYLSVPRFLEKREQKHVSARYRQTEIEIRLASVSLVYKTWRYEKISLFWTFYRQNSNFICVTYNKNQQTLVLNKTSTRCIVPQGIFLHVKVCSLSEFFILVKYYLLYKAYVYKRTKYF